MKNKTSYFSEIKSILVVSIIAILAWYIIWSSHRFKTIPNDTTNAINDSTWSSEREFIKVNKDSLLMLVEKYNSSISNIFINAGFRIAEENRSDYFYSTWNRNIVGKAVERDFFQGEVDYYKGKGNLTDTSINFRIHGDTVYCPAIFMANLIVQLYGSTQAPSPN